MDEYIETQVTPRIGQDMRLFIATFVFGFMLAFGLIVGGLMTAPVFATFLADRSEYFPQLPLSEARTDDIVTVNTTPPKQLFPALTAVENTAPGDWIRIPSIGVNVPLVQSASLDDADVLATLDKGAAMYPNGILPGRLGNTFVAAHSTGEPWKGAFRFAFLRINELEPGNVIHIDYEGTRYTYQVAQKEIITPSPDLRVISDRPVPTMTLMACWPLWSTQKRMLVHSELTNITKLTQPSI